MILDVVTNHHRALPWFSVLDALSLFAITLPYFSYFI